MRIMGKQGGEDDRKMQTECSKEEEGHVSTSDWIELDTDHVQDGRT